MGDGARSAPPPLPASLAQREVEVSRLLARGLFNRTLGASLFVSGKTAGRRLDNVYIKIKVRAWVGATMYAIEHDLVAVLAKPVQRPTCTLGRQGDAE